MCSKSADYCLFYWVSPLENQNGNQNGNQKENQKKSKLNQNEGENYMGSGGYRPGAGRPKKSATEKLLNGNPGKRPVEVLEFDDGSKLDYKPAAWLSTKAKAIWKEVYEWLEKIGCTKGILPYNLDEYAHCKSRWLECEEAITTHGFLLKDSSGKTINNPCIAMAQNYLRQTNDVWAKIYAVVRETKLTEWRDDSPNDDIMEKLLRGE